MKTLTVLFNTRESSGNWSSAEIPYSRSFTFRGQVFVGHAVYQWDFIHKCAKKKSGWRVTHKETGISIYHVLRGTLTAAMEKARTFLEQMPEDSFWHGIKGGRERRKEWEDRKK